MLYIISKYQNQQVAARIDGETSEECEVQKGIQQGCILSPKFCSMYAKNIIRQVYGNEKRKYFDTLNIGGLEIQELR